MGRGFFYNYVHESWLLVRIFLWHIWAGICCTNALHGLCRYFCAAQLSVCHNAVQHPFIIGSDDFDERFFFAVSALQGKHCSYISFMVAGAVDCTIATGLRSKFPEPVYFLLS